MKRIHKSKFNLVMKRMAIELDPIIALTNCWVAGGAIRDLLSVHKIRKDIDLYHNGSRYEELLKLFKSRNFVAKSNEVVKVDKAIDSMSTKELMAEAKRYVSTILPTIAISQIVLYPW